jgi:hypothetical protein
MDNQEIGITFITKYIEILDETIRQIVRNEIEKREKEIQDMCAKIQADENNPLIYHYHCVFPESNGEVK